MNEQLLTAEDDQHLHQQKGVDDEIKLPEPVAMRVTQATMNASIPRGFIEQHLEDAHGIDLTKCRSIRFDIFIQK